MKTYDAIVVGSGATGGWAAKQLSEGGMEVLMIEAGRRLDPAKDFTEHHWPYQMRFRGFGRPGEFEARQRTATGVANEYTTQLFVNDADLPYTTPPDRPFLWARSRHVGGRSVTWGRQSYRYSNYDFQAASHDGYGVNWPFRYEDLAPYYDLVESFIGVSGRAERWEALPDGKFLPPMNFSCGELGLKKVRLVKDVDGLYDRDPKRHSDARFIREIGVAELKERHLDTLPFERVLLDLLETARLLHSFQIVNGRRPEQIRAALNGEHVGTIVHATRRTTDQATG